MKWNAYGSVVASTYIGEVEADTEAEAIEKAGRMAHVSVCHQCSENISDPMVEEITLEEIEDE